MLIVCLGQNFAGRLVRAARRPALACRSTLAGGHHRAQPHRRGLLAAAAFGLLPAALRAQPACPALLDYTLPRLQDDAPQPLCQFAGKVVLVVNTASYCGYTGQYEGLEKLYTRYAPQGLVVLGVPSNDFKQESANRSEIAALCFNTYGVKFPMFAPQSVTGPGAHPFYAALAKAAGQAPRWNFHKYLIDRQGRVVANFPSAVEPLDARLTARIEQLLAAR
jgi:glutathione peroxidase